MTDGYVALTGGRGNFCGKSLGQCSVDGLRLHPKPPKKINSDGWWEMACPLQRQTKWKAQSLDGIGFRMEQPQMRETGLATKMAFSLQLGSVVTEKTLRFLQLPDSVSFYASSFPSSVPSSKNNLMIKQTQKSKNTREVTLTQQIFQCRVSLQAVHAHHVPRACRGCERKRNDGSLQMS